MTVRVKCIRIRSFDGDQTPQSLQIIQSNQSITQVMLSRIFTAYTYDNINIHAYILDVLLAKKI